MPIFPQDTFHPQILSYLFRVGSESKKHLAGKQVIRLISWPWISTRSRISRGPLCPILHLSPHLSPRESICLHKILSLGRGRRTVTFFPFPPRTFLLVSKGRFKSYFEIKKASFASYLRRVEICDPPTTPLPPASLFRLSNNRTRNCLGHIWRCEQGEKRKNETIERVVAITEQESNHHEYRRINSKGKRVDQDV